MPIKPIMPIPEILWTFSHRIYERSATALWTFSHKSVNVQPQLCERSATALWTFSHGSIDYQRVVIAVSTYPTYPRVHVIPFFTFSPFRYKNLLYF